MKKNREDSQLEVRMALTRKFKSDTIGLRNEILPPNTWLLISNEKNRQSQGKGSVVNLNCRESQFNKEIPAMSTPPQSPRSVTLSPSNNQQFMAVTTQNISIDYTNQLHQLCASSSPSLEFIRIVLSSCPMSVRRRNKDGDLPLHVALCVTDLKDPSIGPSPAVIRELLQVYPESAAQRNGKGILPLFLACRHPHCHPSAIRALLQSYPAAIQLRQFGCSPLHMLAHQGSGSAEAVSLLLNANPSLASLPNNFGNLPLHYLAAAGCVSGVHADSVRILLSFYPAGAVHKNKLNESPVCRAISRWLAERAGTTCDWESESEEVSKSSVHSGADAEGDSESEVDGASSGQWRALSEAAASARLLLRAAQNGGVLLEATCVWGSKPHAGNRHRTNIIGDDISTTSPHANRLTQSNIDVHGHNRVNGRMVGYEVIRGRPFERMTLHDALCELNWMARRPALLLYTFVSSALILKKPAVSFVRESEIECILEAESNSRPIMCTHVQELKLFASLVKRLEGELWRAVVAFL